MMRQVWTHMWAQFRYVLLQPMWLFLWLVGLVQLHLCWAAPVDFTKGPMHRLMLMFMLFTAAFCLSSFLLLEGRPSNERDEWGALLPFLPLSPRVRWFAEMALLLGLVALTHFAARGLLLSMGPAFSSGTLSRLTAGQTPYGMVMGLCLLMPYFSLLLGTRSADIPSASHPDWLRMGVMALWGLGMGGMMCSGLMADPLVYVLTSVFFTWLPVPLVRGGAWFLRRMAYRHWRGGFSRPYLSPSRRLAADLYREGSFWFVGVFGLIVLGFAMRSLPFSESTRWGRFLVFLCDTCALQSFVLILFPALNRTLLAQNGREAQPPQGACLLLPIDRLALIRGLASYAFVSVSLWVVVVVFGRWASLTLVGSRVSSLQQIHLLLLGLLGWAPYWAYMIVCIALQRKWLVGIGLVVGLVGAQFTILAIFNMHGLSSGVVLLICVGWLLCLGLLMLPLFFVGRTPSAPLVRT